MAQTERLFDVIQILRSAKKPVLAAEIAEALEVSVRTVYRDIAHLQARQVPIQGATGVGYVMRAGYDLPPLSFDEDEAEAIILGLQMIARTGDRGLWNSAKNAARKQHGVAPGVRHLVASSWGSTSGAIDAFLIRRAIRSETKLHLAYTDASGKQTDRTVWPLAIIYYCDNEVLVAWCETRHAIRHFRLDRMQDFAELEDRFCGQGSAILAKWEHDSKAQVVETARPFLKPHRRSGHSGARGESRKSQHGRPRCPAPRRPAHPPKTKRSAPQGRSVSVGRVIGDEGTTTGQARTVEGRLFPPPPV